MHYFEFAVIQSIEVAFQVNSSWREVRRQLPPLQLYAPVEDLKSAMRFSNEATSTDCAWNSGKVSCRITWKKGGFVRTRTNPPVSATVCMGPISLSFLYYSSLPRFCASCFHLHSFSFSILLSLMRSHVQESQVCLGHRL